MANICWNRVAYCGDNEMELIRLYLITSNAKNNNSRGLLRELGCDDATINTIDGRTNISSVELVCAGTTNRCIGVMLEMESAWGPCVDFMTALLTTILPGGGDCDYVYIAEEPGCDVFINTDLEGRFFSERVCVDAHIPDDGEFREYYGDSELRDLISDIKKWSGVTIKSFEDLLNPDVIQAIDNGFRDTYGLSRDSEESDEFYLYINVYTDEDGHL